MKKIDFKGILEAARFHSEILVRGIARTMHGALIAGLLGASVYGFAAIGGEAGYVAVFDFVATCATLAVAISNLYMLGMSRKKGKK